MHINFFGSSIFSSKGNSNLRRIGSVQTGDITVYTAQIFEVSIFERNAGTGSVSQHAVGCSRTGCSHGEVVALVAQRSAATVNSMHAVSRGRSRNINSTAIHGHAAVSIGNINRIYVSYGAVSCVRLDSIISITESNLRSTRGN